MLPTREEFQRLAIPIGVTLLLTLVFFIVFDRWNSTEDPFSSIAVPIFAVIGVAAGIAVDRWRLQRSRTLPPKDSATPTS